MAKSLEEKRLELHQKLLDLVGHAYFQPPESVRMVYPAAVYNLTRVRPAAADDTKYLKFPGYLITIIDRDTDVDWISKMFDTFEYCYFERPYVADNLNHYSFIVYYLQEE